MDFATLCSEETINRAMYQLSSTLYGHEDDVKALTCLDSHTIVSGSRDSTVRVWNRQDGNKFDTSIINYKSSKFINALAIYGFEYIISAGNDHLINLSGLKDTIFDSEEPKFCLVGHTANICSLDTFEDLILSGSWDATAKVWNLNGEVLHDLKGHEGPVWSVKILTRNTFLTCGADGTIRKWEGSKQIHNFKAHEDVVRDILLLPNGDIVSCSNDTTIKIWDGETFALKATLVGHQNFIYSLSLLPNGNIVSSGEDRSIRIWENNQCIQAITLPCISVWKVMALPNGDIVSASSDSLVRIFTKHKERFCNELELQAFKKELESSSVSESTIPNISRNQLPGIESLETREPKSEGEIKYVNNNMKIEMYQWNSKQWDKIGEIVSGKSSNQKKFYMGSYYDYVFDVDIKDGAPPLKLPFNTTDNPYSVAEQFLADNELPYSYVQEVVNFILKNAEGVNFDSAQQTSFASNKKNGILPIRKYIGFTSFEEFKLITGFKKLNEKQPEDKRIPDSKFEMLINCQDYKELCKLAIEIIQEWDFESKLIGFDILRAIISKIQPFEELFPIIKTGLDFDHEKINMMTLRILCNTFLASRWGEQIFLDEEIIHVIFNKRIIKGAGKLMEISKATLILNFSVLIAKFNLTKMKDKVFEIIKIMISEGIVDEESNYRLLTSIGTLNTIEEGIEKGEINFILKEFERFSNIERFEQVKNEII